MNLNRFTKIGEFTVDSGLVWIGDPCYIDANDTPPFDDWNTFVERFYPPEGEKRLIQFTEGVGVQTKHGDGCYPVYAMLDNKGNHRGLFIDFDSVIEVADDDDHDS